ncbi:MAG: hypothetical protein K2L79_03355, partial [Bacteroidales bacterium]|nr:hypothetical protein [Bacteroidales bacterium]
MKNNKVYRLFLLKGNRKNPADAEQMYVKRMAADQPKGSWTDFHLPEPHAYLWLPERGADEARVDYLLRVRTWGRRWADKARALPGSRWALTDLEWQDAEAVRALAESFLLNLYVFDTYKAERKAAPALTAVEAEGVTAADLTAMRERAAEVNWVKSLVERPVSDLNAAAFAREMAAHLKPLGVTAKLWTRKDMEKAGMGGLLGVN